MTYLLKIRSWENDADNYNTVEIRSEDKSEIEFFIKVAKLFTSVNRNTGGFGNSDRGEFDVEAAIDKVVADHTGTIPRYWSKDQSKIDDPEWWAAGYGNDGDFYNDHLYDLIGTWLDGQCYRVFESFKVFKVSDIADITSEF